LFVEATKAAEDGEGVESRKMLDESHELPDAVGKMVTFAPAPKVFTKGRTVPTAGV